jgi:hypothetical protein
MEETLIKLIIILVIPLFYLILVNAEELLMGLKIKTVIGYVPAAIVLVPLVVAGIRQSLYYKGCMDGMGYIVTAMLTFLVGGVLNLVFLAYAIWRRRATPPSDSIVTNGNFALALVVAVCQLTVLLCFSLSMLLKI